uniref:Uncharacterized protein n=1 Tax=Cynoglossus semilaevis TaxID=244447 RepID=A0A3P8V959_CYNSE
MVPLPVIHFLIHRPGLFHLESLGILGILCLLLGFSMTKQKQTIGFCGSKIKGNGARLLGIPFTKNNIGLWRLKSNGVQCCYILTLKGHGTVDLHLGIPLSGQPGQLQSHIIILIHNLKGG